MAEFSGRTAIITGGGASLDYFVEKRAMKGMTKSLVAPGAPHGVHPGSALTCPGTAAMKTLLSRVAELIEPVDFILSLCSFYHRSVLCDRWCPSVGAVKYTDRSNRRSARIFRLRDEDAAGFFYQSVFRSLPDRSPITAI
ncbi:MAG: hypothetical protein IJW17_09725 [Lentisphaeria bacterium]|nr:hypothetical protein [Lentisphaeria bacterium]